MRSFLLLALLVSGTALGSLSGKVELTDGKILELEKWGNKPYMIVNIATRCGYTGQLEDLEKLYKKYQEKGFHILGIPSNDFGGQTPEANSEVEKFCRLKYGASFPIAKKTKVVGEEKSPIIGQLVDKTGGGGIKWNFEKFLVLPNGSVKRFSSKVKPLDQEILKAIDTSFGDMAK